MQNLNSNKDGIYQAFCPKDKIDQNQKANSQFFSQITLKILGIVCFTFAVVACGKQFVMNRQLDSSDTSLNNGANQAQDEDLSRIGKNSEFEIASCAVNSLIKGNKIEEKLSVIKFGDSIKIKYHYQVTGSSENSVGEQTIVGTVDRTYRNIISKDLVAILLEKAEMTVVHNGGETRKTLDKTEISLSAGRVIIEEWEPILILKSCKTAKF